jgi:peptide-methionine (R)-S-oxide reductase
MKSPWLTVLVFALLVATVAAVAFAGTLERKKMTNHTKASPARTTAAAAAAPAAPAAEEHIVKTAAEWKQQLTPPQYHVLREAGTQVAFTGKYWHAHTPGTYVCAACDYELFSSKEKFASGTGWPSFWEPSIASHVAKTAGRSIDMYGVEVTCARCGGHLGHVFDDGPKPTGLRYCINSVSLNLVPTK